MGNCVGHLVRMSDKTKDVDLEYQSFLNSLNQELVKPPEPTVIPITTYSQSAPVIYSNPVLNKPNGIAASNSNISPNAPTGLSSATERDYQNMSKKKKRKRLRILCR